MTQRTTEPKITPIMRDVLYIFLGWLLGMLSPIVVNAITKRHRNNEVRKTILSELDWARLSFASNVYILESRFGTYDRQLLEWILPVLKNYKGPNPTEEMAKLVQKHTALSDAELAQIAQTKKARPGTALSVKKYRLPYLEARLADLGGFDEASQAILLDIRGKVDLFNEEVDEARFYFKLTYSKISEDNHKLANESVANTYLNLAKMARVIVERIDLLKPLHQETKQSVQQDKPINQVDL